MDGQRSGARDARRRRRGRQREDREVAPPLLIAARRPNAPPPPRPRSLLAASAAPKRRPDGTDAAEVTPPVPAPPEPKPGRSARIIALAKPELDDRAKQCAKLLARFAIAEGRGAITRVANEVKSQGFEFPEEQEVQIQLLEHADEGVARAALDVLDRLLDDAVPVKPAVLEQRLRRLEEYADDAEVRAAAAALRRRVRG